MRVGRCALPLLLLGALGCVDRALSVDPLRVPQHDLALRDLAIDLAAPDLARPIDFGALRHVGQPCDFDEQCIIGHCIADTRGAFTRICTALCDGGNPCADGLCVTFDLDVYWCLPACDPHMADSCPADLICCSGGADFSACVSTAAIACEPL